MSKLIHADLTYKIRGAYFRLFNAYPHDYPEEFYQKIMELELQAAGLEVKPQFPVNILYKEVTVGLHQLDLLVSNLVDVELKAVPKLEGIHQAQIISYLKAACLSIGLLLNFGSDRADIQRAVNTFEGSPRDVHPLDFWTQRLSAYLPHRDALLEMITALETVYAALGCGFVFRIYSKASQVELRRRGLDFQAHTKLDVRHRGVYIGEQTFHHLTIGDEILVAPVAVTRLTSNERNKVKQCLASCGCRVGLIANFGAPQF